MPPRVVRLEFLEVITLGLFCKCSMVVVRTTRHWNKVVRRSAQLFCSSEGDVRDTPFLKDRTSFEMAIPSVQDYIIGTT